MVGNLNDWYACMKWLQEVPGSAYRQKTAATLTADYTGIFAATFIKYRSFDGLVIAENLLRPHIPQTYDGKAALRVECGLSRTSNHATTFRLVYGFKPPEDRPFFGDGFWFAKRNRKPKRPETRNGTNNTADRAQGVIISVGHITFLRTLALNGLSPLGYWVPRINHDVVRKGD